MALSKLFFSATTSATGRELWQYEGFGDPYIVDDLNPGSSDGCDVRATPD